MIEDKVFEIGKHRAPLPGGLLYATTNHVWARQVGDAGSQIWQFGFTSYALALMRDIYFLDWSLSDGLPVDHLALIGHIETSKAESDLYAPVSGTIVRFNEKALADPAIINADGYGAGWLYEIQCTNALSHLVDVDAYLSHLHATWANTERMIKGGMNRIVDESPDEGEA